MKSRREFLRHGAAIMAALPITHSLEGAPDAGGKGAAGAAFDSPPPASGVMGPQIEETDGSMGPVIQLPDGRFLAVYPEGRKT